MTISPQSLCAPEPDASICDPRVAMSYGDYQTTTINTHIRSLEMKALSQSNKLHQLVCFVSEPKSIENNNVVFAVVVIVS